VDRSLLFLDVLFLVLSVRICRVGGFLCFKLVVMNQFLNHQRKLVRLKFL